MKTLHPFWRYYGGKWRAAPRYPAPQHSTIIEPFAGAAGYSTRHYDRNVILIEKFPKIAEIWRWLIGESARSIRAIPFVEDVNDLPAWVPQGGRYLIGFWMNAACAAPCVTLSSGRRKLAAAGYNFEGWVDGTRERIATQVEYIRHWRIIEGDWSDAPFVDATWYVDPPYNNKAGSYYVHPPSAIDFARLGAACRIMPGQVIVCENEGADWLPFVPFGRFKAGVNNTNGGSREVIWTKG